MSIIAAIVPNTWTMANTAYRLAPTIEGHFEVLFFKMIPNKKGIHRNAFGKVVKTCYLRLSEKLDPQYVIERLATMNIKNHGKIKAFIPKEIPDKPMGVMPKSVPTRDLKVELDEILMMTHNDLLKEIQIKYCGLYSLSQKSGHKLCEKIAQVLFKRLKNIIDNHKETRNSCFQLSKVYRKAHPHFADFQMILSNLHQIEDKMGKPRTQIVESDLMTVSTLHGMIDNVPNNKVFEAIDKYSNNITDKIKQHINSLDWTVTDTDGEEQIARKRVRKELKKIEPYLSLMVQQVMAKDLVPMKWYLQNVILYGEPFLPPKDVTNEFLRKYNPLNVVRSDRMYNCMMFKVTNEFYPALMTMDGSVIGGAKLVIRPSEVPLYSMPDSLTATMRESVLSTTSMSVESPDYFAEDVIVEW